MQILNVTLAFYILIHVVRCASVQQAASQLPNDTINRKFHHAIQGSHLRDGATTCGVATRSDWPLRTPPTQSGVSAAVRGQEQNCGRFPGRQERPRPLRPGTASNRRDAHPRYHANCAAHYGSRENALHCTASCR